VSREAEGRRLTYAVSGPPGPLIAALGSTGVLRDVSIVEPDIEEVVTRLYTER
jgi:ABC-2 type transport system ATP-binding protein